MAGTWLQPTGFACSWCSIIVDATRVQTQHVRESIHCTLALQIHMKKSSHGGSPDSSPSFHEIRPLSFLEPGNGKSEIFAGMFVRRNIDLAGYAPFAGWVAKPENIAGIGPDSWSNKECNKH